MKIHHRALVDPKALLADSVEIGPYCVVGPGVEIGPESRLLARVTLAGRVKVGARNLFHPTVCIGGPPQDHEPAAPDGRIEIGDDNVFREAVTVHLPKMAGGVTRIGSRNRLDFGSHVAHDSVIGNQVTMGNLALLGGHVLVDDFASIEALVAIHQFVTVGRHVLLGAHSSISEDAPPFMEYSGYQLRPVGVNRESLERIGTPPDVLQALSDTFRWLWESELPLSESVLRLEQDPREEVREVARFLRAKREGRMGRSLERLPRD